MLGEKNSQINVQPQEAREKDIFSLNEFGAIGRDFKQGLEEILYVHNEESQEEYLNMMDKTDNIVNTPEYKELPEEEKAQFLRKCLQLTYETLNLHKEHKEDTTYGMAYQPFDEPKKIDTSEMLHIRYVCYEVIKEILVQFKDVDAEQSENCDSIVDFWNDNRDAVLTDYISNALSKQNPNRAANNLLKLLRKEEDKNHLSAVLYRLEFGQIDISEDGVKYLEKMYDLGEANNPDYFAQRLTASGDIGIFNENRVLQKYFNLGDLSSEEQTAKPQIHEFAYETLFHAQPNETEKQRQEREQYLVEFKEKYFGFYDDEFFAKTGIRFNNLDFKEQGWFLLYYKHAPADKKEGILNFAQKHGENGFKTFLSLELGEEMGDKILSIGDNLKKQEAQIVFDQFSNIAGQIDHDTASIDSVLDGDIKLTQEELENIKFNLLKQGRGLLVDFANKTEAGIEFSESDILQKLQSYSRDLTLTASVYKTLAKERALRPEELKGVNFEIKNASAAVSEVEINAMIEIYKENFQKYFQSDPAFKAAIIDGFRAKFNPSSKTNIFTYKKNNKLLAFLRVDDVRPGVKYFGSFNASLKGANIGQALLETLIKEVGAKNIIEAHVIKSEEKMLKMYTEVFGFKIVKEEPNYAGTEIDVVKIQRPANMTSTNGYNANDEAQQIDKIRNQIDLEKAA